MSSEVQRLVEDLGKRLGRSVAIDDSDLRLMAYNTHTTDVDTARTGSILQRGVPRALVRYVYECGVGSAVELFTLPARPDLGIAIERLGMPIRHQGSLLGILWLLGSEGGVTEMQAGAIRRTADAAGLALHREYVLGNLDRTRERELGRQLLLDEEPLRAVAAEQLLTENLFAPRPASAVVVTLTRRGLPLDDQDRLALAAAAETGRLSALQRHTLSVLRPDHAVIVLAHDDPGDSTRAHAFGVAIRERALAEANTGTECHVGLGSVRSVLSEIRLSYDEALRAAEIGRRVRSLGPVVRHDELGIYDILAELPPERLKASMPPGLIRLFDRDDNTDDTLIHTLDVYFDDACDIKRTSDDLNLHRASLYYRLKRIQTITGLDLSVGDDRFVLQMGLKIARISGMF